MTGSANPTCPRCGDDLVLEMDPASPPDAEALVLLADPPFRYVCVVECDRRRDRVTSGTARRSQRRDT